MLIQDNWWIQTRLKGSTNGRVVALFLVVCAKVDVAHWCDRRLALSVIEWTRMLICFIPGECWSPEGSLSRCRIHRSLLLLRICTQWNEQSCSTWWRFKLLLVLADEESSFSPEFSSRMYSFHSDFWLPTRWMQNNCTTLLIRAEV